MDNKNNRNQQSSKDKNLTSNPKQTPQKQEQPTGTNRGRTPKGTDPHTIRHIQAKTLLSHRTHADSWFGCKYTMNIYRGCEHQCIYCDSRSECYQIRDFNNELLVKTNAIKKLKDELPRKRKKGTICFGAMGDPYTPAEMKFKLVQESLEVIRKHKFPIHLMTKSDKVIRDIEIIKRISKHNYAAITFTITTANDKLCQKIEPNAPPSSKRFEAMKKLADLKIYTGTTMMPILPFINDTEQNIKEIVRKTYEAGGKYILFWIGVTLRDVQRDYFYKELDKKFPGISKKYKTLYGDKYECNSPRIKELTKFTKNLCQTYGLTTKMKKFKLPDPPEQIGLDI